MAIKILGDIVSVVSEHISNPSKSGYHIFVGLEHYDSGEPVITRHGSTEQLESSVKHFIEGDILVARRNVYLKRAGVVDFEGVTSGDSIVLRVKEKKYKDIIPFILNTDDFWDYAEQNSDGTMSKRLAPDVLLEYECNIPENHQSIADKLWAAYKLKVSYKQMITAADEMVKSQFIEMFNEKGFPLAMIKSFADVSTGGTPSKANPEYWNGDKPWVSAEDMKNKYVYDTLEKVTEAGYATCKIIPVDTLMYVCRGSIGVMAINKIECATNQSICRAKCHDNVCNVEFLYHALMYQRDNIKKMGTGTSFKSLNQTSFSELKIELPPYNEQMKFVSIAQQADKSKFELRKSIEAIDAVIKSLING